ncbi:ParB/RepB/Spo0J family partition protein [Microaerobacter geothermalis]|uniref:ParB/RepB/Spo0J family partition protein n=1 Tax=Microaerobacter geothermalis TaxID=674972 RepID=UPI001F24A48A|nr:ParB/RepB/Spo0J family partition protein [Microaerobacter geothermalis]MCF6095105.1 ParB/RepB/Spo0J family partition protein [Microaerobacter geothermalis]
MNKRLGRGLDALISSNHSLDEESVIEVEIHKLRANPYQPRKTFSEEALDELAESIKEHGIIQPIIARKVLRGYEIVAGERRWRAAQQAHLDKVPVVVKEFTDQQVMEIALIENLQREDLNAIEEAQAYHQLMTQFQLTQDELAKKVGKSRPHITNFLRLLQLPEEIQHYVSRGTLSMGHARALLAVKDSKKMKELASLVMKKKLSVRQLEDQIKEMNTVAKKKKKETKDIYITESEEKLRGIFGTKVYIRPKKDKGKIEIEFFSKEDLERIIEIMTR